LPVERLGLRLLDHPERGAQERLDAPGLAEEAFPFVLGRPHDRPCLAVSLRDDELGFAPRGVLRLGGRLLGGDQARGGQLLAVLALAEALVEVLDAVGQLSPLAPHLLVAVGDVLEQAVDVSPLVAEQRAPEAYVSELNRGVPHLPLLPRTCSGS